MRALIVTSDMPTAGSVGLSLRAEGWQSETADLGEEALDWIRQGDQFDMVVIGDTLADMQGVTFLKQLRVLAPLPAMMLSHDSALESKVRAFRAGCDDYMMLPFHKDELVVRATALVLRSAGHASPAIQIGAVSLNLAEKQVRVNDHCVPLTGKEYLILELLALRRGRTLTKENLLDHLYGGRDEPELKIIDVFICKLRRKLKDMGGGNPIETVWGRGYRVDAA